MPLYGTRDIATVMDRSALMPNFSTDTWELPRAGILQVMYEIRQEAMVSLIPSALHPTIPPTIVFCLTHAPTSSVGPFTMAEVRVGCRAGGRPRGFVARCYVDTEAAANELRSRWGYPAEVAEVKLRTGYDRHRGTVVSGGTTILEVALQNPEPINGGDIQYLPAVHVARIARDGAEITRIVQVDPDYVFHKADRGKPLMLEFDPAAFGVEGADAWWPVSASYAVADITMPHIRYVLDPTKPAIEGVERVG